MYTASMALVIKARSAGLLLLIFLRIRQQCGRLQILRRTENRQSAQLTVGANSFARGHYSRHSFIVWEVFRE